VGESPTRRLPSRKPTGAIMEVPLVQRRHEYGDVASVRAVTRVNTEQASKGRCAGRPVSTCGEG